MKPVSRRALALVLLAACSHPQPFAAGGPDALPPFGAVPPVRLTFNQGDDRHPAVTGGLLVFSRLEAGETGRERCLAYMPAAGGRILRETCPHPVSQTPADTFVDTWTEPALSADGQRVAFFWQQGSLISVLGFYRTYVVVAPVDRPEDPGRFVWEVSYRPAGGLPAEAAWNLSWQDSHTLRFVVGHEYVFKVKGGGLERYTDTTFVPFVLADLDIDAGTLAVVPGTDSILAWAPAPDGGVWLVRPADSLTILHLAPGDTIPSAVATCSGPVTSLAAMGDVPVALAGDTALEWPLTGGGLGHLGLGAAGPARRVAAVPGSRSVVVEIERGIDAFGAPANLWRYLIP